MEILAKSKNIDSSEPARTLKEHINDCLVIFSFLRQSFPKAAELSGMGDLFWEVLYTCVVFHDLGKAHNEFQKVLNGIANQWNFQRHEFFSLPFVDSISQFDKDIIQLIRLVVVGHHKDFKELGNKINFYDNGNNFGQLDDTEDSLSFEDSFTQNVNTTQVITLLSHYNIQIKTIIPRPIYGLVHGYLKKPITQNQESYFKLMLLFGGLKWCDHLGSAMVNNIQIIEDKDFTFLAKKQSGLILKGFDFYEHQKKCAYVDTNLILTAPTGSGKTESAFIWLQSQIKNKNIGRVFYILPFTASINAMYERLNEEIGNEKVGMLHGKLSDYLNKYFDDLQYDLSQKKDSIKNIKEKFRSVITPIKVCTPFQLLKNLFGLKGYEQGIFEMAGCYLIFDEIHAYSPDVFAQIKVLLEFATEHLKAKVMIMTATMPKFLQIELENSIGKFTQIKANQVLFDNFKRHKIELKEGLLINDLVNIEGFLVKGKKVLVVCNTVKSAQKVFLHLKNIVKENEAVLLHGSFSGIDRSKKEKELMQDTIKLLVGTQAIEVSLDIDYDMIFTEPAPIDALIQRFGRVNRKRLKGICACVVYKENNESDKYIYNFENIAKTIVAFEKVIFENQGIIDESILQESINFVYDYWNEKDKGKFDTTYKFLSDALTTLSPMLKNKNTEDDFYRQFDGIKILPQSLKIDYQEYLNNFDFITAESLKVQIRKGRYISWKSNGNIKSDIYAFSSGKKVSTIPYQITNKKYSSELGLLVDEEESWQDSEFL
ncbi:CRISPR-associated helicase Cas3' [Emticicia oligotrophica]|uniref:CRISPR-associated helicase Cas3' n=1 Tax=Emticicia oligotrophica TaxID=312279 RepID=UPI00273AEE42|nr:CRISPR-associated helicase Cas3' [Emticicia oligotrophica]